MHRGLEFFSLDFVFDLAADPYASERGHQYKVSAGNTDVGREGWAFGADPLFDDLNDDFVTAFENFLDGWFEPGPAASKFPTAWIRPTGALNWVFVPTPFLVIDPKVLAAENIRRIVTRLAKVLRFDVADVEKSVSPDAEIDEGSLDTRFDIDDFALIDVSNPVVLAGSFGVELFENSVFQKRDSALLGLRDVD
jgi:hypothetical protein